MGHTRETISGHLPQRPTPDPAAGFRRGAGDRKKTCLMKDRKKGTIQKESQTKALELENA